jgi:hypothetical protein
MATTSSWRRPQRRALEKGNYKNSQSHHQEYHYAPPGVSGAQKQVMLLQKGGAKHAQESELVKDGASEEDDDPDG